MKQYQYKARNPSGQTITGTIDSADEKGALKALREHQYLILSLQEKKSYNLSLLGFGGKKVPEREVATFTRLLSTMIETGLPLTDALADLSVQVRSSYFHSLLLNILHDIQGGVALSESMSRYPLVFDNLYINLLRAGEASGKMAETLGRLADTLEANLDFKAKVKGAMIYPIIIVAAMGGIGTFMITTIIPKIAEVYKEFGAELPLPTRILIAISDFIRNDALIVVLILIPLYLIYLGLRKNPTTEYALNNLFFRVPAMGPLNAEVNLAVMMRTMGALLGSGVAMLDGLKIVAQVMDNNYFRRSLVEASQAVEKGLPLSLTFRRNPLFPVMISQLLAIGEETGTLENNLLRLATFYEDSAARQVKVLTTVLEPLMILLMGAMVGGLAIAVLLPMFNLVNVIK